MQNRNVVKDSIRDGMWRKVEVGEIAQIMNESANGTNEFWINASQVFVRCTHCGKIVNKTYNEIKKEAEKTIRPKK